METHPLIVTRIIIITLIMACLLSCENNTNTKKYNESKYTKEIIVYLVDQFTKPIPSPPKSLTDHEKPVLNTSNKIFSVGIKSIMKPISAEYSVRISDLLKDIDTTFNINYEQEKRLEIPLEQLKKTEKYTTRYVNDGKNKIFETIDILYDFSTINFNHDATKAILIMGMSRGKLSGFADILVLEKVKGLWQIIFRKNLLIS